MSIWELLKDINQADVERACRIAAKLELLLDDELKKRGLSHD